MVSVVGFGANNLGRKGAPTEDVEGATRAVRHALDLGINFFDCADCYGKTPGLAETYLGKALGKDRDKAVVVTKFGMDMQGVNGEDYGARGSRSYIMKAVESSLKRLNTDYIDLLYYHSPDGITPIEETLSALDALIKQGKVRYIGSSNFAGWQIADAAHTAADMGVEPFIACENHYNLIDRRAELEVIPAAEHFNLGVIPYFPLANGLLTGKYAKGSAPTGSRLSHTKQDLLDKTDFDQLNRFADFAKERDLTPVQVAFSWLASRPQVSSVIAGATTPEQLEDNATAVCWWPTPEDEAALGKIFPKPKRIALF